MISAIPSASARTTAAEDERDLSKVNFDLPLFEVYTKGFLEGAAGTLTDAEKEYLPWGAKLMTLECGIRFLTDYLEGDTYFKIHRAGAEPGPLPHPVQAGGATWRPAGTRWPPL